MLELMLQLGNNMIAVFSMIALLTTLTQLITELVLLDLILLTLSKLKIIGLSEILGVLIGEKMGI